jgi:hypothetical protein
MVITGTPLSAANRTADLRGSRTSPAATRATQAAPAATVAAVAAVHTTGARKGRMTATVPQAAPLAAATAAVTAAQNAARSPGSHMLNSPNQSEDRTGINAEVDLLPAADGVANATDLEHMPKSIL